MALGARAGGAADAVDVVRRVHRKVVIDDELYPLHVDTARGDVGGDEYAIFAVLKPFESFTPLRERTVAVNLRRRVSHRSDGAHDALRAVFGAGEYERRARVITENFFKQASLVL